MGMTDVFESAAKAAFEAFGDVVKSATYTQVSSGSYDPALGAVAKNTVSYPVDVVLIESEVKDKLGEHLDDVRELYLLRAEQMPGVTPQSGDTLTVSGYSTPKVIKDKIGDPAGVIWELGV